MRSSGKDNRLKCNYFAKPKIIVFFLAPGIFNTMIQTFVCPPRAV